jgi:putative ABC transport system substrate-binding protein
VGIVYHPAASPHVEVWHAAQETVPYLGFDLVGLPVRTVPEIEAGMTGLAAAGAANAGVVAPHAPTLGSRMRITGLASRYRLPGNYGDASFARSGGLLSYGVDAPGQLQRAAGSVTAILKGADPAEPPVEPPTRYEMIINLVAAQELARVGPSAPLARAEEVIEESDSHRCPRTRHAGRRAAPRTDPAPRWRTASCRPRRPALPRGRA